MKKIQNKVSYLSFGWENRVIKNKFLSDNVSEANIDSFRKQCKDRNVYTMEKVEETGKSCTTTTPKYDKPELDDLAIIMYTSGSTGTPKGRLL